MSPEFLSTLRSEFLYASGDDGSDAKKSKSFYAAPYESGFYNNEMVLLGRDKNALTIDNAIVYDANNKDQGIFFGSIGYDLPLSDKLSTGYNIGFAAIAQENSNKPKNVKTNSANSSDYLGTELNAEAVYKVNDNFTLSARAGYVMLGEYFKDTAANGTPEDPYDLKLIARVSF